MKDVNIYIYTEYTGNMKSGTGKYHVILETLVNTKNGVEPATLKEMGICKDITRNKLELTALEKSLLRFKAPCIITVYTSSDYIVGAFNQSWPQKWKENGFMSKGKPIKHAELWENIMEQKEKHSISFVKSETTPYMRAQAVELSNIKEN